MMSNIFLGFALIGAEWVLYLLIFLSIFSLALIFERYFFYKNASSDLPGFRDELRNAVKQGDWSKAKSIAQKRTQSRLTGAPDFDAPLSAALIEASQGPKGAANPEVLSEVAADTLIQTKLQWEKHLAILATIGNNAPFIGLFGTVIGIIQAFHELSSNAGGMQTVTAGISEALIATAVGIMVAIPAVVAFNLYQRKVRSALAEAESLKSFLIGRLAGE